MNREYFELFVNKSKDYYLDFLDNCENGKKIQFNLMAFLFGLFWFLYRKMYSEAFILFIFIVIEAALENWIIKQIELSNSDISMGIQIITTITIGIVLGFFGNWIYVKHANRKILSIMKKYQFDEEILRNKIQQQGGTSIMGVGILFALIISLIVFSKI